MIFIISVILNILNIYTALLAVYALLSWFPGAYESSFGQFLSRICEPYLKLFDRFNLSFGGLSFNILVAIIVLQLFERLLINLF